MIQVATAFCAQTTPPSLSQWGKEARNKREAEGKKAAAIYEEGGTLEQTEYDALHREFSCYFRKSTIDSWFTVQLFKTPNPPMHPPSVQEKIVDKPKMDQIEKDLKIALGKESANLYDLLGLPPSAALISIQNAQQDAYEKAMKKPKSGQESAKVDAELRVLGIAKVIFKDDISRQGYDIARKLRPFDKLVDTVFQRRALTKSITQEDYVKSVEETRQAGFTQSEAEWHVYEYYCLKRKLPPPKYDVASQETSRVSETVRNEIPRKRQITSVNPEVEALMKKAYRFLEDSLWKEAKQCFDNVLRIAPEYPPAYIGKLCAQLRVQREEHLVNYPDSISKYSHYKKALVLADEEYRMVLKELAEQNATGYRKLLTKYNWRGLFWGCVVAVLWIPFIILTTTYDDTHGTLPGILVLFCILFSVAPLLFIRGWHLFGVIKRRIF
jgi:tetratricopeptide (TPR) repeat protein